MFKRLIRNLISFQIGQLISIPPGTNPTPPVPPIVPGDIFAFQTGDIYTFQNGDTFEF